MLTWNLRTTLSLVTCLYTAYKWPCFIKKWTSLEAKLDDIFYDENIKYNPKPALNYLTIGFIIAGLLEHFIYIALMVEATINSNQTTITNNTIEFFRFFFPDVFSMIDFSIPVALILIHLNYISTFQWQFMNVFLILLCVVLAQRFQQFNIHIKQLNRQIKLKHILRAEFLDIFAEIRRIYTILVDLCNLLNHVLQELIFIVIVGGFYFLTVFIFEGKRYLFIIN